MPIPGRLLTTAMAVMPHTDPDRALEDALSLDIPFWPQLPRLSYREDMYVQAAEHFPGILLDILSLVVFTNGELFISYAGGISRFLERGGVLAWGVVPTNVEPFEKESLDSLVGMILGLWETLGKRGVDLERLLAQSLISPATCCLVNPDREKTVDRAFTVVREVSARLKDAAGI